MNQLYILWACSKDPALKRGLTWLSAHQQPDGAWTATSLNKQRDPESDACLFMTDAATAYAALALETLSGPHPASRYGCCTSSAIRHSETFHTPSFFTITSR
jgi:hypothetical protein